MNQDIRTTSPLILLTNDDGYFSDGIQALFLALKDLGDVFIVAPDRERSASSLSLSLRRPLRAGRINDRTFAVSGTPVDCVYMALQTLLPGRPDVLISGINPGPNLGRQDVAYSGTVGAAIQGAFLGIPSLAVSALPDPAKRFNFEFTSRFIARLLSVIASNNMTFAGPLNINIPSPPVKGITMAKLGEKRYNPEIIVRDESLDPKEYWIGPGSPKAVGDIDSDVIAVKEGFITVTPLKMDHTNYAALKAAPLKDVLNAVDYENA